MFMYSTLNKFAIEGSSSDTGAGNVAVSLPKSSSGLASALAFQGELYTSMLVSCNGYVQFGNLTQDEVFFKTTPDHVFGSSCSTKGASFMMMQ